MNIISNTYNPNGLPTLLCRPHWTYGLYCQIPTLVICLGAFAYAGLDDMPCTGVILMVAWVAAFVIVYTFFYYALMAFEVSDEQLTIGTGIFDKDIERIEMYRICDYRISRPFLLRLLFLENVYIYSTDRTRKVLCMPAMRTSDKIVDEIRRRVEIQKQRKRVYELVNR